VSLLHQSPADNPAPAPESHKSRAARDCAAISAGVGIATLDHRLIVRITGDDRIPFMHGMCSNDIKGLGTGAVAPALMLTEHAHIIADFFVYAEADALLLEIDRALWPQARSHLEKFLVADEVEFDELDLVDVLDPAGTQLFAEVDVNALDLLRVEHGLARVGIDSTDKTIALEARLDSAISFSKGCYLGQETIERATARGGLKKKLFGLRIDGDRLPAAGSTIVLEGKEVGRLTSIVQSPRCGIIGLSILHHNAWPEGTRVTIADTGGEVPARVCELPFA